MPSIRQLGVAIQWSADITEHAHVSEIKTPAHASNNNNYDPQICHFLDRAEKCRMFKLATMICSKELLDCSAQEQDDDVDLEHEDMGNFDNEVEVSDSFTPTTFLSCPPTNYFTISSRLCNKKTGTVPPHSIHSVLEPQLSVLRMILPYGTSVSMRLHSDLASQICKLPFLTIFTVRRHIMNNLSILSEGNGVPATLPCYRSPTCKFGSKSGSRTCHYTSKISLLFKRSLPPLWTRTGLLVAMTLPLSMSTQAQIGLLVGLPVSKLSLYWLILMPIFRARCGPNMVCHASVGEDQSPLALGRQVPCLCPTI